MPVAIVVGAASNLGYQVLKKLIAQYNGIIYFTTDDLNIGINILDGIKKRKKEVFHHLLDITDTQSIVKFRHYLQDRHYGIDLIINNTDYVGNKKLSNSEKVRRTLSTNFYGVLNFGNLIYPLLNEDARVINVSGPAGLLATIENKEIRKRISDPSISEDELVGVMIEYENAAIRGTEKIDGWGANVKSVSKVALNALTFVQHRKWSSKGVVINCVNPGVIHSKHGKKNVNVYEEGAKAILYLAFEAPLSVNGNFVWSNYSVVEWNCDPFVEVSSV